MTAPTGDYGVWLHQVERAAAGEVPNRDFYFGAPPFSLWLLSPLLRSLGTDLIDVWTITTIFFLGTLLLYGAWLARAISPELRLRTTLSGGLVGIGYSSWQAASLPMGSYQPSVLVGLFFLVLALLALGLQRDRPSARGALFGALVGLSAAASVLSKHDYWAPGLVVVVASSLSARGTRAALAAPLAGGAAIAVGLLRLRAEVGFDAIDDTTTSFQMTWQWGIARALPSWRILVAEITATAGWCALLALGLRYSSSPRARSWRPTALLLLTTLALASLYAGLEGRSLVGLATAGLPEFPTDHQARGVEAIRAGGSPVLAAFRNLASDLLDHALPVWIPALGAIALCARRRQLAPASPGGALILAVIAAASHARRGFEHTDAMSALLDVPAIVAACEALWRERAPLALAPVFAALLGLGVASSFVYGAGPATRVGKQPAIETGRGVIHCKERGAERLSWITEQLDARDPLRRRPVLEFGHNGSIAYFTGRPNPTPFTVGFTTSGFAPELAVERIRRSRLPFFLVYDSRYEGAGEPRLEVDLTRWDRKLQNNVFQTRDLPVFESLRAGCEEAARLDERLELYDCAARPRGGARSARTPEPGLPDDP